MKNKKYDADYPPRRMAIEILRLLDEEFAIDIDGKLYYEIEDKITDLIDSWVDPKIENWDLGRSWKGWKKL